ncbi:MAG: hypothetical protein BGO77_06935 [Caedibacter sp. 37-49]|nr:MAG: hypothetical protein BGO77_06935 [Caedibacter sp. 37-49]
MDTYEQKKNINNKQGTPLWFSQMKQVLKKVLRQGFRGGHFLHRSERLSSDEQLFHRGWDLLFESRPRHPRLFLLSSPRKRGSKEVEEVRVLWGDKKNNPPLHHPPRACPEDLRQPDDADRCHKVQGVW